MGGRGTWPAAVLLGLMLSSVALGPGCDRLPVVGNDLDEARAAIQARNWTLAERLLERYLRTQQDADLRWEAWQRLLEVAGSAGADMRTALDFLEAMLMEYSGDEARAKQILQRMGELNENMRRYDRAAEVWSTYIDLGGLTDAEMVKGHRSLAQIHARAGRFETAEDVLQNCLAASTADAGKAQCLYDLADMHASLEHWKEASDLALQIMDMEVDEKLKALAAFLLGDAFEQQKKPEEALVFFEHARANYPNEMVVDNRISHLKKRLKK